jgi:hypothetical protein
MNMHQELTLDQIASSIDIHVLVLVKRGQPLMDYMRALNDLTNDLRPYSGVVSILQPANDPYITNILDANNSTFSSKLIISCLPTPNQPEDTESIEVLGQDAIDKFVLELCKFATYEIETVEMICRAQPLTLLN